MLHNGQKSKTKLQYFFWWEISDQNLNSGKINNTLTVNVICNFGGFWG